MLSVCIPVFNYNIQNLVSEISKQALAESIDFEVLVFDDGSSVTFKIQNRKIKDVNGVNYFELTKNIGRSKIRNLLAQEAKFDFLLFIDCDAEAPEGFIKTYLQSIQNRCVIVGGVSYAKQKPAKEFLFRWRYGIKRESTPVDQRKSNPYNSFKTFNFLISKQIFKLVQFDESLKGYGHEDTLFGISLKKQNIPIIHIDNPLIHLGLESNEIFLNKTNVGIQNLVTLMNSENTPAEFMDSVSLLRFYNEIPQWIKWVAATKFKILKTILSKLLISGKAPMILFDIYKLSYLCALTVGNNKIKSK